MNDTERALLDLLTRVEALEREAALGIARATTQAWIDDNKARLASLDLKRRPAGRMQ